LENGFALVKLIQKFFGGQVEPLDKPAVWCFILCNNLAWGAIKILGNWRPARHKGRRRGQVFSTLIKWIEARLVQCCATPCFALPSMSGGGPLNDVDYKKADFFH
jgi:hypothetical protein